jgi:hypothetical protein
MRGKGPFLLLMNYCLEGDFPNHIGAEISPLCIRYRKSGVQEMLKVGADIKVKNATA